MSSNILQRVHTLNRRYHDNRDYKKIKYQRANSSTALNDRSSTFDHHLVDPSRLDSIPEFKSHPVVSKYADVWRRVRLKIRVKLVLSKLLDTSYSKNGIVSLSSQSYVIKKSSRLYSFNPEKNVKTPFYIINPDSKGKISWNHFLCVVLLYSITVSPFTMCFFQEENWNIWEIIEILIDVIFLIDFAINCLTLYKNEVDLPVTSLMKIIINYAKSWMFIDILCFFPFLILDIHSDSTSNNRTNDLVDLLKLPQTYRMLSFARILKMIHFCKNLIVFEKIQTFFSLKNSSMRLSKSLITIWVCLHNSACLWYFTAKLDNFGPDTWVIRYSYQDLDISSKYLISLYWAFTTLCTVGYGDISGVTNLEKLICIAWMSCGLYFFAFTIGSLSSLFSSIDSNKEILENKLAVIDEFSEEAGISDEIKRKIKVALKYSADTRGFSWIDKLSIINELPKHLRYEIAINMHHGAAKYIKVFVNKDQNVVSFIVPLLQPMFVQEGEFVYLDEEFADEIYFVIRGRVSYYYTSDKFPFFPVQRGDYFGDIEVVKGVYRKYPVTGMRNSELLIMNRGVLQEVEVKYPEFWEDIKNKAIKKEQLLEKLIIEIQEIHKLKYNGKFQSTNVNEFKKHIDTIYQFKNSSIKEEYQYDLQDVAVRLERLAGILKEKNNSSQAKIMFDSL